MFIAISGVSLQTLGTDQHEQSSNRHPPRPAASKLADIIMRLTKSSLQKSSIPTSLGHGDYLLNSTAQFVGWRALAYPFPRQHWHFSLHIYPRADGAKRRARVLIPPAIYTRGNESISEV